MQQRQLILFVVFITVSYATQINYFDAKADIPFVPDPTTIFAHLIQLWTNVTDCPPPSCSCKVHANVTSDDDIYAVKFTDEKPSIGSASVDNLQADTLYSFTLRCDGTDETVTLHNRTDYGNPSAPQNITVVLNSKRLKVLWLTPLTPAGPINNYKLTIDKDTIIDNIPNSQFLYDMTEDYIYGQEHTFILVACNSNRRNDSVCSNPNDGKTSFVMSITTTPAQDTTPTQDTTTAQDTTPTQDTTTAEETTTKQNLSGMLSYSKFFLSFIFCFLLFNYMTY